MYLFFLFIELLFKKEIMALNQNYYTRILDENNTYNKKKHYDSNIYIVYPNNNFSIKKGSTSPKFNCYIKQKGEQFGDALPVQVDIAYKYAIRLYDNANNIFLNESLISIDIYVGEYSYTFSSLDFTTVGNFTGEILKVKISDSTESVLGKFSINVL